MMANEVEHTVAQRAAEAFDKWWASKVAEGYQYGRGPLATVRFGFEAGYAAASELAQQGDVISREAAVRIAEKYANQNHDGAVKALRRGDHGTYDVLDSCKREAEAIASAIAALPSATPACELCAQGIVKNGEYLHDLTPDLAQDQTHAYMKCKSAPATSDAGLEQVIKAQSWACRRCGKEIIIPSYCKECWSILAELQKLAGGEEG